MSINRTQGSIAPSPFLSVDYTHALYIPDYNSLPLDDATASFPMSQKDLTHPAPEVPTLIHIEYTP